MAAPSGSAAHADTPAVRISEIKAKRMQFIGETFESLYHTEGVSVAIRTLRKNDVEAANRLLMRAFVTGDSFRSVIEREFAIQPEFYWVAEVSGEMAGTIAAVHYGEIAYIGMMAVDPDFQGRGIGRTLLETASQSVPCETLLLDATDAGEPMYRRYGFIDEGFSY